MVRPQLQNAFVAFRSRPTFNGTQLIHVAADFGYLELVQQLAKKESANKNPKDDDGITPLHLASEKGYLDIVRFIVPFLSDKNPKAGAELNEKTPMHSAALRGHLNIIQYLCENIEGDINPSMSNGSTVMHCAAEKGHLDVVSFYTNQLLDPNPGSLSNDHLEGRTPLHVAAEHGHLPVVLHICELLEDKNPMDSNGVTPLHLAAKFGHLNVVSFYTNQLSDPNPGNLSIAVLRGMTPLHFAAINGHLPIVQHICNHLEDKNPRNSNGVTPLHIAAKKGHLAVVKYLVQFLDDYHPKSSHPCEQVTPLDMAKVGGQTEVINFFQQLHKSKQRKSRKSAKSKQRKSAKANKNVKVSTVIEGNPDEYDINSVLQSLEIEDEAEKQKPQKKSKKKPKKPKKPQVSQDQDASESDLQAMGATALISTDSTQVQEASVVAALVDDMPVEEKESFGAGALVNPDSNKESLQVTDEPKDSNEHDVYKKAIQAQMSVFECPVCLEIMGAPKKIFGCSKEHFICSECKESPEIKRCPICREDFTAAKPQRRYQSEQLLAILMTTCQK